jgi:hypothetical protein
MSTGILPERDECIEQAYFFRTFRERFSENVPAQDILFELDQEILSTTKLPMAVQFLATELKHAGLISSGFAKLRHYFTPYQAFVMRAAEKEGLKFDMVAALLVLEREAMYKSNEPSQSGLFVYQFETICRNRLGYDDGLDAIGGDPFYPPDWKAYAELVRKQVGIVDFADLVYLRSHLYVNEQLRTDSEYVPSLPPLFGEKEGKIAKASRGRDPLFLFSALQRQLNYPEVPRPKPRTDLNAQLSAMTVQFREMEARIRMLEAETRGTFDPTQFGKPDFPVDDV